MTEIILRQQKAEGLDSSAERLICTGLVVSEKVCRELKSVVKEELFCGEHTRWLAKHALKFYEQHGKPVGRHIQDVFHTAKRAGMKEHLADILSGFLSSISSEYERSEQFNEDYVVTSAIQYFRARSLYHVQQDVRALLDEGKVEDAETRLADYKKIDRVMNEGVNPFTDENLIRSAFAQFEQPLFTLPGPIGRLLSIQLHRRNFISFRGAAKRGKSYALQEVAKHAARNRLNVVFVGIGDMDREEYTLRWHVNLSGRSNDPEDCEPMWVPCLDCKRNQDNTCKLAKRACRVGLGEDLLAQEIPHPDDTPKGYVPCSLCSDSSDFAGAGWWRWRAKPLEPLTPAEGIIYGKRFMKRLKGRDFKLVCYPSRSVTPSGLDSLLERWRDYEDFLPDVMFIDYMDELGSDEKYDQWRHQEAAKWSAVRALAFKWNMLVISADQSDTGGYTAKVITESNFNEDRRRNDVLTGGMGINQTDVEKARGMARWSWFLLRKGHYTVHDQVYVVQALCEGRPLVGSWWRKR